jgi:antitoxin (DNA-binding transcriptional repressor) of toxin-antitoxin stability system
MSIRRVGIADLKDHLSEHLHDVEAGVELLVVHRRRPVARVIRVAPGEAHAEIVPAQRKLSASDRKASSPANWPVLSADLLLEERQER